MLILDAGSGIFPLGESLHGSGTVEGSLFITRFRISAIELNVAGDPCFFTGNHEPFGNPHPVNTSGFVEHQVWIDQRSATIDGAQKHRRSDLVVHLYPGGTNNSVTILIDTAAPLIVRQPDLVRREGAAFIVVPNYGKFEPTDDVRFEDVGGRLAKMGFAFSSDTGTVLAPKGWTLSEDSPGFGSVRVTATDLAGNAAVDEFQIAGVRKTNNLTSSAATIDESAAFSPKLYFDADGNGAGEPVAFVQVELTGTAVPAFGDFLVVSGTMP